MTYIKDYANIYLIFPTLTTESNADVATWLFPAIRYGLVSRDEARAQEARENIKKAEVEDKINIFEGDAVEILPTLNENLNIHQSLPNGNLVPRE